LSEKSSKEIYKSSTEQRGLLPKQFNAINQL